MIKSSKEVLSKEYSQLSISTFLNETESSNNNENGIIVSPNPNSGEFSICIKNYLHSYKVEICNASSQIVKIFNKYQNNERIQLNSKGIYIIKIVYKNYSYYKKVIVK